MGATIFWNRPKELAAAAFLAFGEDVRHLVQVWQERMPSVPICGPGGTGDPLISAALIQLNGDASRGEACEDFFFPRVHTPVGIGAGFWYCKTRRYSYGGLVVAAVLLAHYHAAGMTLDARALPASLLDLAADLVDAVRGERPPAIWFQAL